MQEQDIGPLSESQKFSLVALLPVLYLFAMQNQHIPPQELTVAAWV